MTLRTTSRLVIRRPRSRRGVVGILAMMFMILFGSLALAMAIVSKGNLQTAQTQLRVNRAIGAADTGLGIAASRLERVAAAFRIEKGDVTPEYAEDLWDGTFLPADGQVLFANGAAADMGLREFLASLHASDSVTNLDPDYAVAGNWLATEAIVIERNGADDPVTAVQVTYVPLPAEGGVRAISTGYAWDFVSGRWVQRTAQQDFRILKRVRHAILGPSKIMIGKNVQIDGPMGARYTGVDYRNGHPLVVNSDFMGLSAQLDTKITLLYEKIQADDADGDNRLRLAHSVESRSLDTLNEIDYDGDGTRDSAFSDQTHDGSVDEFDVFLNHYDVNNDGKVALADALRTYAPHVSLTAEFAGVDDQLALLIDSAIPDRNGDGVVDGRDTVLGYRDGVLDHKDRYAKIRGAVAFRATRAAWEAQRDAGGVAIGDYQRFVRGSIRVEGEDRPVTFAAGDDILPEIDSSTFNTAQSGLAQAADGASFESQAGLAGAAWTARVEGGVVTGQTFAPGVETIVEATPYGSASVADYYQRPVFRDRVFRNVMIPMGLNALFENCTFVGVTRVQNYQTNTHQSWQFYGQQKSDLSLKYPPPPAESEAQLDNDYFTADIIRPSGFNVPRLSVNGTAYVNTKPLSNNIRFNNCTFVGAIVADKPDGYTHIRNKLQFTGATKFYTEHPTLPDDPGYNPDAADLPLIERSSMMLPHYSVDIGSNNAPQSQDVNLQGLVIAGVLDVRGNTSINGALLLTFEPVTFDGSGNPILDPALQHYGQNVGNPANFNATLGYFGPDGGDLEGFNVDNLVDLNGDGVKDLGYDSNGDGFVDPGATSGTVISFNGFGRVRINWNPDMIMPDGLIAPIEVQAIPDTYREGRLNQASAGGEAN